MSTRLPWHLTVFARAPRVVAVGVPVWLCLAGTARAELVTFTTGRTMSVRSHRDDDGLTTLMLRTGGEMVVESALVAAIAADEFVHPEPSVPLPAPSTAAFPADPVSPDLQRNPRFDPLIQQVSAEQGVDPVLVRAVIQVESDYQPRARSPKGSLGLMQLMPATARQYGVTNLFDPTANIRAGVTHLRTLLDRYPLDQALAAYNAGAGAVDRFDGIPPYPETVDYVSRIRALTGR